ncbi:MAG: NfeD family protein [Oscillospiraceae bacterium]|nr:NfeD family protein [Oscillospiraceae bacterium]
MDVIVWLILLVLFLFMEANTVAVVSIWFAAGALASLIASLCGAQLWLQITLFLCVSAVCLAGLRPVVRKYVKPRIVRTNVDAVLDAQGYVTAQVDNLAAQGQVKLGAMEWTARSSDGSVIPQGTLVKVDRIEGVKAFVSKVEAEEKV